MPEPTISCVFAPDANGTPRPKAMKASNVRTSGDWPHIMPLPRWEPAWIASEVIDNVLDYGQAQPEHPSWEYEPTLSNLDHVIDHVMEYRDAFLSGVEVDRTDLTHAMTRLAMEIAKQDMWKRDKICNVLTHHFFAVGQTRCVCGGFSRLVPVVGKGLPEHLRLVKQQ